MSKTIPCHAHPMSRLIKPPHHLHHVVPLDYGVYLVFHASRKLRGQCICNKVRVHMPANRRLHATRPHTGIWASKFWSTPTPTPSPGRLRDYLYFNCAASGMSSPVVHRSSAGQFFICFPAPVPFCRLLSSGTQRWWCSHLIPFHLWGLGEGGKAQYFWGSLVCPLHLCCKITRGTTYQPSFVSPTPTTLVCTYSI